MSDNTMGINPWTRIWTNPRETIRKIVDFNPKFRFIVLSFLHGLPILFYMAQDLSLGDTYSSAGIILVSVILATLIGMLSITIGSALFLWTGKWIGGQGTYYPIRAASSWSNVPNIVVILGWLALIFYFKNQVFLAGFQKAEFTGNALALYAVVILVQLAMSIWSLVILVKGLAEVQGFSAWKGLLNVLIPFVMLMILAWILGQVATFFLQ
ncbi:MAG: YIP1 family protein [Verrucomicrobia bacterium]|nr:YIP1 family protein [Verrucomicrobiota bacterium]